MRESMSRPFAATKGEESVAQVVKSCAARPALRSRIAACLPMTSLDILKSVTISISRMNAESSSGSSTIRIERAMEGGEGCQHVTETTHSPLPMPLRKSLDLSYSCGLAGSIRKSLCWLLLSACRLLARMISKRHEAHNSPIVTLCQYMPVIENMSNERSGSFRETHLVTRARICTK